MSTNESWSLEHVGRAKLSYMITYNVTCLIDAEVVGKLREDSRIGTAAFPFGRVLLLSPSPYFS